MSVDLSKIDPLADWLPYLKVTRIPRSAFRSVVEVRPASLPESRFLGACAAGHDGIANLYFRGNAKDDIAAQPPVPLVWDSDFGPCLRVLLRTRSSPQQANVYARTEAFSQLSNGRFRVAIVEGGLVASAWLVDATVDDRPVRLLQEYAKLLLELMQRPGIPVLDDPLLADACTITKEMFGADFGIADWLQHGWMVTTTNLARFLSEEYTSARRTAYAIADPQQSVIKDLVDALRSHETFRDFYRWLTAELAGPRLLDLFHRIIASNEQEAPRPTPTEEHPDENRKCPIGWFVGHCIMLWQQDPSRTGLGSSILSIDGATGMLFPIKIEVPQLDESRARGYWPAQPLDLNLDRHVVLQGDDFPLSPADDEEGWDGFQLEGTIDEAEQLSRALIDEALALKKWTVPPRAVVDLRIGPFVNATVVEHGNDIYFVFRSKLGHYRLMAVQMDAGLRVHAQPYLRNRTRVQEIEAALRLIMAAIVRDFWVVEERQAIFGEERRTFQKSPLVSERRIVYLPRVRYVGPARVRSCRDGLNHAERRQHFVAGHSRRVERPSPFQIVLARQYGVALPEGHTFVRPHYRGSAQRDVIYRSRSALQLLFEAAPEPATTEIEWFRFEREVAVLLEKLGFDVVRKSTRGHTDFGVDIFAQRQKSTASENWLIQCKCFSAANPVRPGHVRELLGAAADLGDDARLMLVTTSDFTEEALRLALKHGVKTVNGLELSRIIRAVERSSEIDFD